MSFYTSEIHDRIGEHIVLPKMPLLKQVWGKYFFSGVMYMRDQDNQPYPVYIANRWLSVRPDQVERILNHMNSGNTTNVWYEERKFTRVPGVLVELDDTLGAELMLNVKPREDAFGRIHRNELVVSHELLGLEYLKTRNVEPQTMGNEPHIDEIPVADAALHFRISGYLPRVKPRVNQKLANQIVGL